MAQKWAIFIFGAFIGKIAKNGDLPKWRFDCQTTKITKMAIFVGFFGQFGRPMVKKGVKLTIGLPFWSKMAKMGLGKLYLQLTFRRFCPKS